MVMIMIIIIIHHHHHLLLLLLLLMLLLLVLIAPSNRTRCVLFTPIFMFTTNVFAKAIITISLVVLNGKSNYY